MKRVTRQSARLNPSDDTSSPFHVQLSSGSTTPVTHPAPHSTPLKNGSVARPSAKPTPTRPRTIPQKDILSNTTPNKPASTQKEDKSPRSSTIRKKPPTPSADTTPPTDILASALTATSQLRRTPFNVTLRLSHTPSLPPMQTEENLSEMNSSSGNLMGFDNKLLGGIDFDGIYEDLNAESDDDSNSECDYQSDDEGALIDVNNPWLTRISDVFSFRFPLSAQDAGMFRKNPYDPTYIHQIFTEGSIIYGYKGLEIDISVNPHTLHVYISVGYRQSIFDNQPQFRARGPRVVVDNISEQQWRSEKRKHTLCEYTYTTDGNIEILGLDQYTVQLLLQQKQEKNQKKKIAKNAEKQQRRQQQYQHLHNTQQEDSDSETTDEPKSDHVSVVERPHIAAETLKNRQESKKLQRERVVSQNKARITKLREQKCGNSRQQKELSLHSSDQHELDRNSNIYAFTPVVSASTMRKVEELQLQFDSNKASASKTIDQTYDDMVRSHGEEVLRSPERFPQHELEDFQPLGGSGSSTKSFKQCKSPNFTILDNLQTIGDDPTQAEALKGSFQKRIRLYGDLIDGELDVDDEARIKSFTVCDMPTLHAIYYTVARHFPRHMICPSLVDFQKTYEFGVLPQTNPDSTSTTLPTVSSIDWTPPGTFLRSYRNESTVLEQTSKSDISFHLYVGSVSDPAVREFHQRVQPLILLWIDNASFIDSNDHTWEILFSFQKTVTYAGRDRAIQSVQWKLVGFTSLYSFYKPPSSTRLRLSQILVLPHAQRAGHGMEMLKGVYAIAEQRGSYEVNIEDPAPGMQMLRDLCDTQRALDLGYFQHHVALELCPPSQSDLDRAKNEGGHMLYHHVRLGRASHDGCCRWTPEQLEDARRTLFITKLQSERIMECICLAQLDLTSEEQMKEYRLRVKRRLMSSHKDDLEGVSVEQRKVLLQELFEKDYNTYLTIHKKLRIK